MGIRFEAAGLVLTLEMIVSNINTHTSHTHTHTHHTTPIRLIQYLMIERMLTDDLMMQQESFWFFNLVIIVSGVVCCIGFVFI